MAARKEMVNGSEISTQRAQSFDIGELHDEIKKQILLPKARLVFVRSTFIDDNSLIDAESLGAKLDKALTDLSAKGEKAPILFLDLQKYDVGYSVSDKYSNANGIISLTYKICCNNNQKVVTISVKTVDELVQKIIAGLIQKIEYLLL